MRRERGFTLLEVLIALAILAVGLSLIIQISAHSVRSTSRARNLTVAVGLARGKMLDIEDELLEKGFQEVAVNEEDCKDFSEEGYPSFEYCVTIEKVELPEATALQEAATDEAAAKDETKAPGSQIEGMLGGIGTGAAGSAGAGMLMSQFGMIKGVLENAIRKVTLTVKWKSPGGKTESFNVVCYFTDARAVDAAIPGRKTP